MFTTNRRSFAKTLSRLALVLGIATASSVLAKELSVYVGAQPPGFTLPDLVGESHDIAQYEGSVVVVNFWASWCPPCIAELPSLMRLAEQFDTRPFKLLAVNMGESPSQVSAFLERAGMKPEFPVLLDTDGRVLRSWKVYAFPTTFVIDKQGLVRYQLLGAAEWDSDSIVSRIEQLMGSLQVTRRDR